MRELNFRIILKKLLPTHPRCGKRFIDTRTGSKIISHGLLSGIQVFLNDLKQSSSQYRSDDCRKLLANFKKREPNSKFTIQQFPKKMASSHNRYCFRKSI